jgi:short subunit dehydrogenase-like uncharacterized protein
MNDLVSDGGPITRALAHPGVTEATVPRPLTVWVTGATGNQGGVVARRLLLRGHQVRALPAPGDSPAARELERLGAKVRTGEISTIATRSSARPPVQPRSSG